MLGDQKSGNTIDLRRERMKGVGYLIGVQECGVPQLVKGLQFVQVLEPHQLQACEFCFQLSHTATLIDPDA